MLFLRGIDADSSPVSQKEIKDTKGNLSKSCIKMQFPFQLEMHIGAHTLLCALRLLAFLKSEFCSPKSNIQLQSGVALQVFSLCIPAPLLLQTSLIYGMGFNLYPGNPLCTCLNLPKVVILMLCCW